VGDIEQIEFSRNPDKAFERIQREASTILGRGCYVESVARLAIADVMLFIDEDALLRAQTPPWNARASWLAGRHIVGPGVVTGADSSAEIPGLSLERAMQVRKILDDAGPPPVRRVRRRTTRLTVEEES
jgi:hypothetical protein